MASQLTYLWNAQRVSAKPFRSLLFTHADGRVGKMLEEQVWSKSKARWGGTEWWDGREMDGLWLGPGKEGGFGLLCFSRPFGFSWSELTCVPLTYRRR